MNWLQKTITQWNRVHGTSISSDVTEAEFLESIETQDTVIDAIEMSGDQTAAFESRLSALENVEAPTGYVSQEAYDAKVADLTSKMGTLETQLASLTSATETNSQAIVKNKAELATEINVVKSTASGTHTLDVKGDPVVNSTKAQFSENKDEIVLNSKDIFTTVEVVPGLL